MVELDDKEDEEKEEEEEEEEEENVVMVVVVEKARMACVWHGGIGSVSYTHLTLPTRRTV